MADRYWKILQSRPRRDTAFDLWYRHYLDAGKLEDLVATVTRQAKEQPENFAAQLLLGLVHERRGDEEEALAAYTAAEKLAAENYYPAFLRGAVLARQQRPDDAAAALTKAIGLKPPRGELLDMYKRLGRIYLQQGKTADALKTFSEMAEQFPDDRQVLEELAQLLAEERQLDEAIRRWEQVAKLAADDPYAQLQAQIEVAALRITQGSRKEGIALLEQVLDRAKPESWLERDIRRRIEAAYVEGDYLTGLIAWCEDRIQRKPQDLGTLLQLARTLEQANRGSEALVRYDEAIKLAPTRRDLRGAFIEALASRGKLPEAIAQCQSLAEKHPQDADILLRLGQLHLEAAKAEELPAAEQKAAEIWRRIAAIRPSNATLAVQVAEACRNAAQQARIKLLAAAADNQAGGKRPDSSLWATAEEHYREALRRAPKEPQYHEYLGEFLHTRGRKQEAIAAWSAISQVPSETFESWHRLAEVLASFNCLDEAIRASNKTLALKNDDYDLHDFHLGLLIKQNDHKQALAALAHLDRLAGDARLEKALNRRVEVLAAANQVDAEIARLQAAAGNAPLKDRWLLALLYNHRWRYSDAAKALEASIAQLDEKSPNYLRLLEAYADTLKRAGDLATAVEQYQRLAKLDPRYRFSYYQEIIQLELQRGRSREAKEAADLLVRLSPSNLDGYRVRAAVAFRLGDAEEGLRNLRQAVKIAPRDVDIRSQLARALAERGQRAEALEHLWRAFELSDDASGKLSLISGMVDVASRSGKADELVEQLRRMRARQDEPKVLTLCLAEALVRLKRTADAQRELVALVDARGDDVDVLRILAQLAERSRTWDAAVGYQERVVALDDSRQHLETLARYLSEKGDATAAARIWQRMLEEAQDDTVAAAVVDRQLQQGRVRDALALAELHLEKEPQSWRMLLRAASANYALSKYDEAKKHFAAILDLPEPAQIAAQPASSLLLSQPPAAAASAPSAPPGSAGTSTAALRSGYAITSSGVVVAASAPPFATSLPEAQEIADARACYTRLIAMQQFVSRGAAASRTTTRAPTPATAASQAALHFPTQFALNLNAARLEATIGLLNVALRTSQQDAWLLEQMRVAESQPHCVRRVALALSASSVSARLTSNFYAAENDLLDRLAKAMPDDPLPHLIRLNPLGQVPSSVPEELKLHVEALHRSYYWLQMHRPAAAKELAYYYITRLVKLGDSTAAAEVAGKELGAANSFDEIASLASYIVQSGDVALLRKLLARTGELSADPALTSAAMPYLRMIVEHATANRQLTSEEDSTAVIAVLERCIAMPPVVAGRPSPFLQAPAATTIRLPSTPQTAVFNQQTAVQQQVQNLTNQIRQTEDILRQLRARGSTDAQTQVYTQRLQSLNQQLQRLGGSLQMFPSPNTLLDAERFYLLQRVDAWLSTLGRRGELVQRMIVRAGQTQGSESHRYRMASICALWWSNEKSSAVTALKSLTQQLPDEPMFKLALAQAHYSMNDLRESLAVLETFNGGNSELTPEIERLRSEIRRRWSDVARLRDLKGHTHVVRSVAVSPDGKQILSGSYDRTLRIWETSSGKPVMTLSGHSDLILCVAWSPNNFHVASGGYDEVKIWDAPSGACILTLKGHAGAVRGLAFSPDGKTLATAGDDKTVRLWDVQTGQETSKLEGHTDRIFAVAFSPDGKMLASGSADKSIRLWDVAAGKAADTLTGHSGSVASVAFSRDGKLLASGGDDNHVMLWWLPTGKVLTTLQRHTDSVFAVAFSPDGKTLASASADRSIKIWPLDNPAALPNTLLGHGSSVASLAYSPDSLLLVSAGYDELIKVWSLLGEASLNPAPSF